MGKFFKIAIGDVQNRDTRLDNGKLLNETVIQVDTKDGKRYYEGTHASHDEQTARTIALDNAQEKAWDNPGDSLTTEDYKAKYLDDKPKDKKKKKFFNWFKKASAPLKLDPKNDENWAPSGGYSIKGYGKKFNFDPGSTSVDTLSYKDPSNYDFRIKGKRDGKDVAYRSTQQAHATGTKVKTPREQRAAEVKEEEHIKTHGTRREQIERESAERKARIEAESKARREKMQRESEERRKRFGLSKSGALMKKLADDGRNNPEIRRAISERALIKSIDPKIKTDSLGFFKGTTANKILKQNIPEGGYRVGWKTVGAGIDTNKVKKNVLDYTNRYMDKKPLPSANQLLKNVGASKSEINLANTFANPEDYTKKFRKNVRDSWKRHRYNEAQLALKDSEDPTQG